ncbi:MAG: hypothetical protein H7Y43_04375, partial [Akkermansiaceae bacterium]|nr:hypothetical protein [Verrucomicrobiales bacterium]
MDHYSTEVARRGNGTARGETVWQKVLKGGSKAASSLSLEHAVGAFRPSVAPVIKRREGPVLSNSPLSAEDSKAALLLAEDVRRAQSGDEDALAELIETNRAWVRGIAYTVLGDAHLAEDAAQEVCVRVVKHLKGLDTPEAFRPWVYRMTRNVALSMAQRRER